MCTIAHHVLLAVVLLVLALVLDGISLWYTLVLGALGTALGFGMESYARATLVRVTACSRKIEELVRVCGVCGYNNFQHVRYSWRSAHAHCVLVRLVLWYMRCTFAQNARTRVISANVPHATTHTDTPRTLSLDDIVHVRTRARARC